MKILKFAAIDIGSNAIRLFFANVIEDELGVEIRKESLIRNALRLGDDAFIHQEISPEKVERFVNLMRAYKYLIAAEQPIAFRACATSAMRDSKNSAEIVERVKREVGLQIDVIDGSEEAKMIYLNEPNLELNDDDEAFLFMDIGGGSIELTLLFNDEIIKSKSFNLGTIRQLNNLYSKGEFKEMEAWVKKCKKDYKIVQLIGSGGNINKISRIIGSRPKDGSNKVTRRELNKLYGILSSYTYEQRISILGLNPDRADVIIPAAETFLKVMKWSGSKTIQIPTIGVSEGIIRQLYTQYKEQHSE